MLFRPESPARISVALAGHLAPDDRTEGGRPGRRRSLEGAARTSSPSAMLSGWREFLRRRCHGPEAWGAGDWAAPDGGELLLEPVWSGEGGRIYPTAGPSFSSSSSVMLKNCSSADWRFSTISRARTSGSGRFSESSRLSSFSQKMSRFALSRCISSS